MKEEVIEKVNLYIEVAGLSTLNLNFEEESLEVEDDVRPVTCSWRRRRSKRCPYGGRRKKEKDELSESKR